MHRATPSIRKLLPRRPTTMWPAVPIKWYLPVYGVSVIPFRKWHDHPSDAGDLESGLGRCCSEAEVAVRLSFEEDWKCTPRGGQPCWLLFETLSKREATCDYLTREEFRNEHDPEVLLTAFGTSDGSECRLRLEDVQFPRRPRRGDYGEPLVGYGVVSLVHSS